MRWNQVYKYRLRISGIDVLKERSKYTYRIEAM